MTYSTNEQIELAGVIIDRLKLKDDDDTLWAVIDAIDFEALEALSKEEQ